MRSCFRRGAIVARLAACCNWLEDECHVAHFHLIALVLTLIAGRILILMQPLVRELTTLLRTPLRMQVRIGAIEALRSRT